MSSSLVRHCRAHIRSRVLQVRNNGRIAAQVVMTVCRRCVALRRNLNVILCRIHLCPYIYMYHLTVSYLLPYIELVEFTLSSRYHERTSPAPHTYRRTSIFHNISDSQSGALNIYYQSRTGRRHGRTAVHLNGSHCRTRRRTRLRAIPSAWLTLTQQGSTVGPRSVGYVGVQPTGGHMMVCRMVCPPSRA
jgi:hypothetical protein